MTSIACLPPKNGRAIIHHRTTFWTAGSGAKSGNNVRMNEWPKLGRGKWGVHVRLWVYADEQPRKVVAGILGLRRESRNGFRSCSRIRSLQL
jgi:hypothetical protein